MARSAVWLTALSVILAVTASPYAGATPVCAETSAKAIEQALRALDNNDPASDREALICTVAALATLDARLQGLSDGTVPFDGQIYIPKGYVMQKPPTKEAD